MNADFLDISGQNLTDYKVLQYQMCQKLDMSNNPFQSFEFLKRFRHVTNLVANNANIF